jgi:lamin tail-like protein
MRLQLAALILAVAGVSACYTPPTYVVPTEVPTPTAANPTAIAALQSGPTATQAAVSVATSVATSPVHITDASFDPANVYDSAITLSNGSSTNVDVGDWVLLVSNYRVTLPKTDYMTIAPGHSLIVHLSQSATPTSGQNVYVGLGALDSSPRVNADQIVLLNSDGHVASTYAIR